MNRYAYSFRPRASNPVPIPEDSDEDYEDSDASNSDNEYGDDDSQAEEVSEEEAEQEEIQAHVRAAIKARSAPAPRYVAFKYNDVYLYHDPKTGQTIELVEKLSKAEVASPTEPPKAGDGPKPPL
jgi:hypothetical protein